MSKTAHANVIDLAKKRQDLGLPPAIERGDIDPQCPTCKGQGLLRYRNEHDLLCNTPQPVYGPPCLTDIICPDCQGESVQEAMRRAAVSSSADLDWRDNNGGEAA